MLSLGSRGGVLVFFSDDDPSEFCLSWLLGGGLEDGAEFETLSGPGQVGDEIKQNFSHARHISIQLFAIGIAIIKLAIYSRQ